LASGILLFATNRPEDAWLYTLHRYTGAGLLVLLIPKTRIVVRSLTRKWRRHACCDLTTIAGIALTGLVILTLALALAWTLNLLPFYLHLFLYVTPLGLHWYLAFALVPFFVWHSWKRWTPLRRRPRSPAKPLAITRRTALHLIGIGAIGFLGLGALDLVAATTNWNRRFTGSRLVDSFEGNSLPVTNSDAPPVIDIATWRLRVSGRVTRPLELAYADLNMPASTIRRATLDCTLGWASTQNWRGTSVAELLERAGVDEGARQVTCRSVTGAFVVLPLAEAREALIATYVGDERLSDAHGFPARLVAPTRRGYHWIKWMGELVVS
jgi:molybdopterin-dependent oxidoreductase-like protein protein